ncbi:DNA gyrase inhibitor YacG [Sansalvadorimonas verongulae]|uniref:DNA gyrase inhibitor YacG n=1 Tax=Sansalvadorimonas verongulae TaxID=2172824 RepID=UPI0012BC7A18|nr:DNA gyrase inhibitor YacG [Sansalvadorimonas verongulae]MTI15231.1 DNA gyrase inhibitor YacG [Sansalvadorimonas verongulae]
MTTTVKCPQCQKPVEWKPENTYRPFCCERCKMIDLGAWAAEEHKIAGTPQYDDVMSESLNDTLQ